MAKEERDSHTKQLYTILRKSIKTFASGYCYALVDTHGSLTTKHATQLIMAHADRCLAMLSDMLGVEWSEDEVKTIEMDVMTVCEEKLRPF
ncbi:MAG: hypothetical protein GWN13_03750 [Phycisphaerae bacterium]|nr:hypothetical protein [Phycisphaerae bacterium]